MISCYKEAQRSLNGQEREFNKIALNMNIEEAVALVEKEINEPDPSWPDKPIIVVLSESTIETDWGWVFFYQSQRYIDTDDISERLAGNAPFIVNRITGEALVTGTAHPIEHYIAEYEANLADME